MQNCPENTRWYMVINQHRNLHEQPHPNTELHKNMKVRTKLYSEWKRMKQKRK